METRTRPTRRRAALEVLLRGLGRWMLRLPPDTRSPVHRALDGATKALSFPYNDLDADECQCEKALRDLVEIFTRLYLHGETQNLDDKETAALWEATAYVDSLDEAARGVAKVADTVAGSEQTKKKIQVKAQVPA